MVEQAGQPSGLRQSSHGSGTGSTRTSRERVSFVDRKFANLPLDGEARLEITPRATQPALRIAVGISPDNFDPAAAELPNTHGGRPPRSLDRVRTALALLPRLPRGGPEIAEVASGRRGAQEKNNGNGAVTRTTPSCTVSAAWKTSTPARAVEPGGTVRTIVASPSGSSPPTFPA